MSSNRLKRSPGSIEKPSLQSKRFETLGLIVIVLLIIALTITRSWHYISWSAR